MIEAPASPTQKEIMIRRQLRQAVQEGYVLIPHRVPGLTVVEPWLRNTGRRAYSYYKQLPHIHTIRATQDLDTAIFSAITGLGGPRQPVVTIQEKGQEIKVALDEESAMIDRINRYENESGEPSRVQRIYMITHRGKLALKVLDEQGSNGIIYWADSKQFREEGNSLHPYHAYEPVSVTGFIEVTPGIMYQHPEEFPPPSAMWRDQIALYKEYLSEVA